MGLLLPKGENSSSSSSPAPAWLLLASARFVLLALELGRRVSQGTGFAGVNPPAGADTRLEDELFRGRNSDAATLRRGEPKGEGEAGRLVEVPDSAGGTDEMGEPTLVLMATDEVTLVVERLERVRFQGRGDARGEPEPMTPG